MVNCIEKIRLYSSLSLAFGQSLTDQTRLASMCFVGSHLEICSRHEQLNAIDCDKVGFIIVRIIWFNSRFYKLFVFLKCKTNI